MHRVLLAMAAFPVLLFAACSDSDGGGSGEKTEDGLKAAVRSFGEDMFGGEYDDAYKAFAAECRDETTLAQFKASMRIASGFMEALAGAGLDDIKVDDVEVRNFDGESGEVKVTLDYPDEFEDLAGEDLQDDTWKKWVWEDDRWVNPDCEGLASGLGATDDDNATTGGSSPATPFVPGAGPAVGEKVEAGGSSYTIHGIEDPAEASGSFGPAEGNRWVVIEVSQTALDDTDSARPFDFTLQDAEGFVYDSTFGEAEPEFPMEELAPGRTVRGFITFEVPEDAELVAVYVEAESFEPAIVLADLTR